MPTIAIVGVGPSLGFSIAKVFGSQGFTVALISRNKTKLDHLVGELAGLGIAAAAFPADVSRRTRRDLRGRRSNQR
ncbi:SDR family NAD(P)-dependent oxidoreductase [Microbacterium aurum]